MVKTFQFYYTQYNDHFFICITLQHNFPFFNPDDSKPITTRKRERAKRMKKKIYAKTVAVAIVFPFSNSIFSNGNE